MVRSFSAAEWIAILASGLVAAVAMSAPRLPVTFQTIITLLALLMVFWISVRDVRDFIIPDGPVVCILLLAFAANLVDAANPWSVALPTLALSAVVCGGALLIVREVFYRHRGFDGIGFGDVKLAAVCGAWIGMEGFAWAVFIASATGLAVVAVFSLLKPGRRVERLPFGALLAPACWLLWTSGLPGAQ